MTATEKEIGAQLAIAEKAIRAAERSVLDTADPQKLDKIKELMDVEATIRRIVCRIDGPDNR